MSTDTPAAEKSGGKKKFLLIGLVLVVVAAGLWFTMLRPSDGEQKPEPGEVVTLDPVYVNLAGGGYLKVGLALQMSADAGGHEGGPNGAQALDLIISEFSQADPGDVIHRREQMKKALEEKIVHAYHDEVLGIFYTEYVTQ